MVQYCSGNFAGPQIFENRFLVSLVEALYVSLVPDGLPMVSSLTPMAAISCHNVAQFFIFLAKMAE
jgi:hypothetical protein